MARKRNPQVIPAGRERQPGAEPASADTVSSMAPANGSRMLEMVNRMASEIERDELRLRELLRSLVSAGRSKEALRLLAAWDEAPAGDVLKVIEHGERAG